MTVSLVRLDPEKSEDESAVSVVLDIELGTNLTAKAAINKAMDRLFYYTGNSVYAYEHFVYVSPGVAIAHGSDATGFYGIGIRSSKWLTLFGRYQEFCRQRSCLQVYSSGEPVDNKVAGRGPNGFVFK